ncbi:MAG: hypothetical protein GX116_08805 [Fibrobacter sp.]|nr:hypothetical protein [Fibrobacter sp.]
MAPFQSIQAKTTLLNSEVSHTPGFFEVKSEKLLEFRDEQLYQNVVLYGLPE